MIQDVITNGIVSQYAYNQISETSGYIDDPHFGKYIKFGSIPDRGIINIIIGV